MPGRRRVRRRSGRHVATSAATWFTRPSGRLTVLGVLTLGVVACLKLTPQSGSGSIEDETGAETLATKTSAKQLVEVIGYPDGSDVPIACRNQTSQPMPGQLEFDCGGYTDGTSGGPFLAGVN